MTRYAVLSILRSEPGYVSGEKISGQLGVTRAAVNAAIKSLRSEGYEINSSTNRGYQLVGVPDALTAAELGCYLGPARMERVLCLDSVDSTSTQLLRMPGAPDGQVVVADTQTAGRGRRGRSFLSPKGSGIYLSILFRPNTLPGATLSLTAWTAVAVARAIERVCGVRPGIKWVNDLLLNGKKICGILSEMSVEREGGFVQQVIIGIGVNANHMDFPEELQGIATTIADALGKPVNRARLAAEIITQMDEMLTNWSTHTGDYPQHYRDWNITPGREISVVVGSSSRPATALAITEDYGLLVRYADGSEEVLSSGEVSIKGIYGKTGE